MGTNISTLDNCKQQIKSRLPSSLLTKDRMKEYFDYVSKTCVELELNQATFFKKFPNFPIDARLHQSEFDESMKENYKSESDKMLQNRTINGLRIACSIVLFSDQTFDAKIEYLFKLFDFNEVHSLSIIDIELMIYFCIISGFRSFYSLDEPAVPDISRFTKRYFKEDTRISLYDLMQVCAYSSEVKQFCSIISIELPSSKHIEELLKIRKSEDSNKNLPAFFHPTTRRRPSDYRKNLEVFHKYSQASQLNLFHLLSQFHCDTTENNYLVKKVNLSLQWVYGFRYAEQIRSIAYHESNTVTDKEYVSDSKVIYFAGNIVILYYYKIKKQKYYLEHRSRVCSIAVSKNKQLCATGDIGAFPEIHIWSPNTLKPHQIISSVPDLEIYLIEFINKDRFIAVALSRFDTPLVVYEIESGNIVLSTSLTDFVLNIGSFIDTASSFKIEDDLLNEFSYFDTSNSFYGFTKREIHLFLYNIKEESYHHKVLDHHVIPLDNYSMKSCSVAILNCTAPYINFREARGDFNIYVFCGLTNGTLVYLKFPVGKQSNWEIVSEIEFEGSINIMHFYPPSFIIIQVGNSLIQMLNVVSGEKVFNLDMSSLPLRFTSNVILIQDILLVKTKGLIVSTKSGEVFYVSLKKYQLFEPQLNNRKPKVKTLNTIFPLKDPLNSLCIAEMEGKSLTFVTGSEGIIYVLSNETRLLIQKIIVGEAISAIDCVTCLNGDFVIAVGTVSGRIKMITNWVESSRAFECGTEISFVKFSPKGLYLIAGNYNNYVYRFSFYQDSFFTKDYLQIQLVDENAVSLNFSLDFNMGIIETDLSNFFKVDISNFTIIKEVLNQHKGLLSRMSLKNVRKKSKKFQPLIYDKNLGFTILGNKNGTLIAYESIEHFIQKSGTFHFGHSGPIRNLVISNDLSHLFTLAQEDGCVFSWKINLEIDENTSVKATKSLVKNSPILKIAVNHLNAQTAKRKIDSLMETCNESSYWVNLNRESEIKTNNEIESCRSDNSKFENIFLKIRKVYGFETSASRNSLLYINESMEFTTVQEKRESKTLPVEFDFIGEAKPVRFVSPNKSNKKQFLTHHIHKKLPYKMDFDITNNSAPNHLIEEAQNNTMYNSLMSGIDKSRNVNQDSDLNEEIPKSNERKPTTEIIYYISRFAIITNTEDYSKEKIYQGHDKKISAMAICSSKSIVATAETSDSPKIHIWNSNTCMTVIILKTHHNLGIKTLNFSNFGSWIISISFGKSSSIQVTDWSKNRLIAFRHTNGKEIYDTITSSVDVFTFYTSSTDEIIQWTISGSSILLKKSFAISSIDFKESFISLCSVTHQIQNQQQNLVYSLTSLGRLAVITDDGDIRIKNLNILNPTFLKIVHLNTFPYLVVVSRDLMVRFYSFNFSESLCADLTKLNDMPDNISSEVHSLDIIQLKNSLSIIVGLSNGKIFEVRWRCEINPTTKKIHLMEQISLKKVHSEFNSETKSCDFFAQPSHRKVLISAYPQKPIIAFATPNQMLSIWNSKTDTVVFTKKLTNLASVIKFLQSNTILLIGFTDGSLFAYKFEQKRSQIKYVDSAINSINLQNEQLLVARNEMVPINISASVYKGKIKLAIVYVHLLSQDAKNLSEKSPIIRVLDFVKELDTSKIKIKSVDKFINIFECTPVEHIINLSSSNNLAVGQLLEWANYAISSNFTANGQHLCITAKSSNKDEETHNQNATQLFEVYDLVEKCFVKNLSEITELKFQDLPICMHVKAKLYSTSPQDLQKSRNLNLRDNLSSVLVDLSVAQNFGNYNIFGSSKGDLLIVNDGKLRFKNAHANDKQKCENEAGFANKWVNKELEVNHNDNALNLEKQIEQGTWIQAQKYVGHTSNFSQIEICSSKIYLYTTSINDNCIIKWEILQNQSDNSLIDVNAQQKNDFTGKNCYGVFNNVIHHTYPQRLQLNIDLDHLDRSVTPIYQLKPFKIIGRKASTERSNIHITLNNKLIYISGCCLIELDLFEQSNNNATNLTKIIRSRFTNLFQELETKQENYQPKKLDLIRNQFPVNTSDYLNTSIRKKLHREQNLPYEEIEASNLVYSPKSGEKSRGFNNPFNDPHINRTGKFRQLNTLDKIKNFRSRKELDFGNVNTENGNNKSRIITKLTINEESQEGNTYSNCDNIENEQNLLLGSVSMMDYMKEDKPKSVFNQEILQSHFFADKDRFGLIRQFDSADHFGVDSLGLQRNLNDKIDNEVKQVTINAIVSDDRLNQRIIVPAHFYDTEIPVEIGILEIASDFSTACIATNSIECTLNFWNINNWTRKNRIKLASCARVQLLRFSKNSQNLACIGFTPNYSQEIFFISVAKAELIAFTRLENYMGPKIKDIDFFPTNPYKFITVGTDHIVKWKIIGQSLQAFELNKTDLVYGDNKNKKRNNNVLETGSKLELLDRSKKPNISSNIPDTDLLIVKFIKRKFFITGSRKGAIYIWNGKNVDSSYVVFDNLPITCILCNFNENDFIVGGCSSQLSYFKMGNGYKKRSEELIEITGIRKFQPQSFSPIEVQSLCFVPNSKQLIIGINDGSMVSINIDKYMNIAEPDSPIVNSEFKNPKELSIQLFDEQVPKAVNFSFDGRLVFVITEDSHLYVYQIATLELIFYKQLKIEAEDILVTEELLLLICKEKVLAFDVQHQFKLIKYFCSVTDAVVEKARITPDHNKLILLLRDQNDKMYRLNTYWIKNKSVEQIDSFQIQDPKILDVSSDGRYILIQTMIGEVQLYDIKEKIKQVTGNCVEIYSKQDWTQEGLIISPKCAFLRSYYTQENNIRSIVQIDDTCIAVGDDSGSVF